MTDRIEWNASRDGYTASRCGRFEIVPEFQGAETAQGYAITDNVVKRRWSGDTQRDLKMDAQDVVDHEAKAPRRADGTKKTQVEKIFDWLNEHGKLTRWTAFQELGIAELSSRIIELERKGPDGKSRWLVPRAMTEVKARDGTKVQVMEYHTPIRATASNTQTKGGDA